MFSFKKRLIYWANRSACWSRRLVNLLIYEHIINMWQSSLQSLTNESFITETFMKFDSRVGFFQNTVKVYFNYNLHFTTKQSDWKNKIHSSMSLAAERLISLPFFFFFLAPACRPKLALLSLSGKNDCKTPGLVQKVGSTEED